MAAMAATAGPVLSMRAVAGMEQQARPLAVVASIMPGPSWCYRTAHFQQIQLAVAMAAQGERRARAAWVAWPAMARQVEQLPERRSSATRPPAATLPSL